MKMTGFLGDDRHQVQVTNSYLRKRGNFRLTFTRKNVGTYFLAHRVFENIIGAICSPFRYENIKVTDRDNL